MLSQAGLCEMRGCFFFDESLLFWNGYSNVFVENSFWKVFIVHFWSLTCKQTIQEYEVIRNSKFSRHGGVDDGSARTSCSVVYTATEEIPLNPLRVDVTVQLPNPVVETVQRKDERVEHLCAVARLWGNILYQCTACQDSKACQLLHIIVRFAWNVHHVSLVLSSKCHDCTSPFLVPCPTSGFGRRREWIPMSSSKIWRSAVVGDGGMTKNSKKTVISDLVRL